MRFFYFFAFFFFHVFLFYFSFNFIRGHSICIVFFHVYLTFLLVLNLQHQIQSVFCWYYFLARRSLFPTRLLRKLPLVQFPLSLIFPCRFSIWRTAWLNTKFFLGYCPLFSCFQCDVVVKKSNVDMTFFPC